MLAAAWRGSEGGRQIVELTYLLVEAASMDPLLESLVGDARHCHGYGYLLYCLHDRGWLFRWERFDSSDTLGAGEESCRANLEALRRAGEALAGLACSCREGLLVLHSRRASPGEPRGCLYAHPHLHSVASARGQLLVAVAHNGSVDKGVLAGYVGVDPNAYSDTQLLTVWLAEGLARGRTLRDLLGEARWLTRTALDAAVAILDLSAGEVLLGLYGYVSPRAAGDRARREYYEPLLFRGEGVEGYVSSTLRILGEERGLPLSYERLDGKLHVVELNPRGTRG